MNEIKLMNIIFNKVVIVVTLNVILKTGIRADGFDTVIEDGAKTIHKESWSYGYNCSHTIAFSNRQKPYVADVLQNLIDQYHVDRLSVTTGRNVFADRAISSEKANEFEAKYCSNLTFLSKDVCEQQTKQNSLILTDADLSDIDEHSIGL